ncbi:MAG: hypothetical protein R3F56_08805 [Planctomycetota bacterium]
MEATAKQVRRLALQFLWRWSDRATANLVDDLAQLTTLDTLARLGQMHDPRRLPGLVRTIARRRRYRSLLGERRRPEADGSALTSDLPARHRDPAMLLVSSRWIDRERLLPWLDEAMQRLSPLNSQLLRDFYCGWSCRELAARHRMSPDVVKVRLYRSRERIRACLERRVVTSSP